MKGFRLVRELRKAFALNRYDVKDNGDLYFPESKALAGGIFHTELNYGGWEPAPNLLPAQGRNAILDIALGAAAKQTNFYMVPFATNTTPGDGLLATTFNSTMTEFTNYTEPTRALWTPAAAVAGLVTNAATPVTVTIGSGGQVDMYGLALISASAKLSTAGVIVACALFKNGAGDLKPRLGLAEGDILGLRYSLQLTSA